jgi:hypothetical protein
MERAGFGVVADLIRQAFPNESAASPLGQLPAKID